MRTIEDIARSIRFYQAEHDALRNLREFLDDANAAGRDPDELRFYAKDDTKTKRESIQIPATLNIKVLQTLADGVEDVQRRLVALERHITGDGRDGL